MKKEADNIFEQKMLPHDTETEYAVLSTLIRYNEKYAEYSDILNTELFYYEKEKAIFRCVDGVISGGGITDVNSLANFAKSHDVGYNLMRNDFLELINYLNKATLGQDIERLNDMCRRRLCWKMLQKASESMIDMTSDFDDDVNGVIMQMGSVQEKSGNTEIASYGDALVELKQVVNELLEDKKQYLVTGLTLFDKYYLLRPGTMTVIAAFTGVGKSSLALNVVQAVARKGEPCAYYSLEMGKVELVSRGISKEMNMPASAIVNAKMSEGMQRQFNRVIERNKDLPIYFDDRSTVSFERTIRSIRTMVKTKGIKLAVIDYLQIYTQGSDETEKETAYMARAAKNIAKEMGIAVIVISQLSRGGLHPSIKMLRGSGQIEESADNIVLIDRPEAYPDNKVTKYEGEFKDCNIHNTAKLILSKGRGVGTGCCLVAFNGMHCEFSDIEKPDGGKNFEHDDDLPF